MGEYDDMWHDHKTPRDVLAIERDNAILRNSLYEAKQLFHEAVDNYPVETKPDLWTTRVRAWLEKYERP